MVGLYHRPSCLVPIFLLSLFGQLSTSLRFQEQFQDYNLNQNRTAIDVADYYGKWDNHDFFSSPINWRMPFYTIFLDKFVNGDPTNDDINGTMFEHDLTQAQLRHGGDLKGLVDSLDYIQGMGVEAIYIAGTPFINQPWGADAYSPLDLSLLDRHFGDIQAWRDAITAIHDRGMYIILDNTVSTMGDLIAFEDYPNTTVPFDTKEHKVFYRDPPHQYEDFHFGNTYNSTCTYPRFWLESGALVGSDVTDQLGGCYDSEFDQFGDFKGLGDFDGWKRSLSKAAGVQDRLREWVPSVREKIELFSCLAIMMLDIDGYRIDKATQVTVDALGDFSHAMRECARKVGKDNFFITGEISGGNTYGSIFLGRGRQPDMKITNQLAAVSMTNLSNSSLFIRDNDKNGLDSAAFHYSIFRSLTRLLGMDGLIGGPFDLPIGLVDAWNELLLTNDLVNANTGAFDPRHMFGTTNQDNFRWSAMKNGTEKMLLGQFLTTLHMPGIPLLLWGEEQAFYVLDSTSNDYIFGRQAMSSSQAWKMHGCYRVGSSQYHNFMEESAPALDGCHDDWNQLDHRDPAHPIRNIIRSMYQMRKMYPVLNDGWVLKELSKKTRHTLLPNSGESITEVGMWSTMRGNFEDVQDLGQGNQSVWLVYQNDNHTIDYEFNCSNQSLALISPFANGTTVKNLFYPFDEKVLGTSSIKLGINGSAEFQGCLSNLTLAAWEYRAYVPKDKFIAPAPMITKASPNSPQVFLPGHDARLEVAEVSNNTIPIEFHFSTVMDCANVAASISIKSTTEDATTAQLGPEIVCSIVEPELVAPWFGSLPTMWTLKTSLINVSSGIHVVTIKDASSVDGFLSTNSTDNFFIRVGKGNNPLVFPQSANYTRDLLHRSEHGKLFISHKAAGADQFRYSLNWGSTYSAWQPYVGGNTTLAPKKWSGTKAQEWKGEHVIVQYHSNTLGSSNHVQHGDLDAHQPPRRFPHLFLHGDFNRYGLDNGLDTSLRPNNDGIWNYKLLAEWPATLQVNEWGINPDGNQDQGGVYGDLDKDGVLDRLPPSSLIPATLGLNSTPPSPFLTWHLEVNDGTLRYLFKPAGNRWHQMIIFILMWVMPVLTGSLAVWGYLQSFYQVKFNKIGVPMQKYSPLPLISKAFRRKTAIASNDSIFGSAASLLRYNPAFNAPATPIPPQTMRRKVLIATMEYDIEDWAIKIKIGGLGVMAQLMGKNLEHQDLIWVVPCVGGVEYPVDEPADPMDIIIMGKVYHIEVQLHVLRNITYILLDAPIFRAQTKSDPYPARMDDIDSAIYYSAWNQCIAEAIRRFSPDLYHINDYHGALAPVHLLPETIPCVLSLHNAEFQGLWGMKNSEEAKEVCEVYNLPSEVAQKYVQFGDVFNLLHAGASYLRIHQKGFGAVGVSKKYGKRSWARYPIFWGLNKIGQLPNPDPSDLAEWNPSYAIENVEIDEDFERSRADLRMQAQKWAGLTVDPLAELLVFVGRWSMQKGVDLIADVMPTLLEENEKVQLICIGPVIDLYGKFAALKLDVLMKKYPGRVYSKPEFTALPPYIFSGAEFALIPSRDEPFGLVAVEFGRKGALGIGARVGGLGQMPGWWFTVESTTTAHMLSQFKKAIKGALASSLETRKQMRARSAKQRFPVAQWVADLEELQSTAIRIHHKEMACPKCNHPRQRSRGRSYSSSRITSAHSSRDCSPASRMPSPAPTYQRGRDSGAGTSLVRDTSRNDSRSRSSSNAALNQKPISRARSPLGSVVVTAADDDEPMQSTMSTPLNIPALTRSMAEAGVWHAGHRRQASSQSYLSPTPDLIAPSESNHSNHSSDDDSAPPTPPMEDDEFQPPDASFYQMDNLSTLSLETVVGAKQDFSLQKVDPSFTDSTEEYFKVFEIKLRKLEASNSETSLCIEDYLVKSEKEWFGRFRDAKLGRTPRHSPAPSVFNISRPSTPHLNADAALLSDQMEEFKFNEFYRPPRGIKKYLQYKIGEWPIYTLFLALGQIMAANSYQITLLTRSQGQNAEEFYIIAGIYLIASISWWICYRTLKSVYVLSLPFLLYGLAFLLLGCVPFYPAKAIIDIARVQNAATGIYTVASASGSLYFALNFGDEGGSPIRSWMNRACLIQGTQQIYICALWFWGSHLNSSSYSLTPLSKTMSSILLPISFFATLIGITLLYGLPTYYHQSPGKIPSLLPALMRRKIVLWFFITVLIQNFFLANLTGRNWSYLFSSRHLPTWSIAVLALSFFVIIWALFLYAFSLLSTAHTWILPLFAIGLGAPRWAQILWSCTPIGTYLPWAPSALASAAFGRSLWLWLGVLDALQGVGFGMILLQTLTRVHVAATLIGSQVLGVVAMSLAKAIGPNRAGLGTVFPDFAGLAPLEALGRGGFWVGLILQIMVCVGFLKFFRKEQLSKP